MDYVYITHYIIVPWRAFALALYLAINPILILILKKAAWHPRRKELSAKQIFLYKHLSDVFFLLYFSNPVRELRGGILYKGAVCSVAHLPAMHPCSFEDHLSGASWKCFYKGKWWLLCGLAIETPWNKTARCQASKQDEIVRDQTQINKFF